MSLTVATNVASLTTQKWLNVSTTKGAAALEQLSSASKINKASDDAAGLAISTKLTVKAVSLYKAIDNGNQAVAMLQTAEGGLSTISDILTRLKELATEAASDNNATDRVSLQAERTQLEAQITSIAQGTKYGATALFAGGNTLSAVGTGLTNAAGISNIDISGAAAAALGTTYTLAFDGTDTWTLGDGSGNTQAVVLAPPTGFDTSVVNFSSFGVKITVNADASGAIAANNTFVATRGAGAFTFQLGDTNNNYNQVTATISGVALTDMSLNGLAAWTNTDDGSNERSYLNTVNTAIDYVNGQRANIGSYQSQVNFQVSNMTITLQNTQAAASTIKDADYAKSMSEFSKYQVMTQAGIAMLAQANQIPQQILSLLKG